MHFILQNTHFHRNAAAFVGMHQKKKSKMAIGVSHYEKPTNNGHYDHLPNNWSETAAIL